MCVNANIEHHFLELFAVVCESPTCMSDYVHNGTASLDHSDCFVISDCDMVRC